MALPNGTLLQGGKYQIRRFIGSGGFGCTYEAYHTLMDSRVCIKEFFVKDFCNRDERTGEMTVGTQSKTDLVERLKKKFVEEAQAIFKLKHPSIVSVTDVFLENGTAYYVMDYIDGPSLEGVISKQGRLPEAQALHYLHQIADALAYVHSNNRLHLDIKPANIMITSDNRAVIIDFGVSKQYDEIKGENTSSLLGFSPGYAPLEQLGQSVGNFLPATDIYALGATFYKALSGNTPIMANIRSSEELELEPLPADISPNTREAITRALMLGKKQRPQSIAEFLSILDGRAYVPGSAHAMPAQVPTPVAPASTVPVQPVQQPMVQQVSQYPQPMDGGGNVPPVNPNNAYASQTQFFDDAYYDDDEAERRKKRNLYIIIGAIAAVVITAVIIFFSRSKEGDTEAVEPIEAIVVDSLPNENEDEALAETTATQTDTQSKPAAAAQTAQNPTNTKVEETKPQPQQKQIKFALEAPSNANVGEIVLVNYQLDNAEASSPQAPTIANCSLNSGPRVSTGSFRSRVNGEVVENSYVAFTYSYTAEKAGTVTIPALTVNVGGKTYTSNSAQLTIKGTSTTTNTPESSSTQQSDPTVVYSGANVDEQPQFPGGEAAMYNWISSNLRYPMEAADEGVTGRVVVGFVVTKDGSIGDAKIVRGRDPFLDKEALRLVKSMPKWTPGKIKGKPVNVEYTLPITFRLN